MKKRKNNKKNSVKKIVWLILISYAINIIALSVLMLKVIYPYYRILAFAIYGISWAIFIYALKIALFEKFKEHKKSLFAWLPAFAILLGSLLTLWTILNIFPLNNFEIAKADKVALTEKMNAEQIYAENYIQKLSDTEKLLIDQIRKNSLEALTLEDKNKTKELWREYLSYFIALEEITDQYRYFYQINYLTDRELNERGFLLAYSAFVANYSSSLNLIKNVEDVPFSETLLNEEFLDYEIPINSYYNIQKSSLKPENLIQVMAGYVYLRRIKQDNLAKLIDYSEENYKNIVSQTGKNPDISFNGAMDYFEKNMFKGWFPVQKDISERMGNTKIPLNNTALVDLEKIKQLESAILPGDIFLQRRNWYLSNVGLPGFWKHTVIYIGSLSDLDREFGPSEITQGLTMSEYIKNNFPELYDDLKDDKKRTLEAESEGVVSFTLEKSMSADYVAVLRPKITQGEKIKALIYAFRQFGKPYDFNFDFLTDSSIVCSELFYKAYPMMNYNLRTVSGRMILSSNDIVRDFDEKYDEKKKFLDLVYFIDANEKSKESFFSDLDSFRASWKRNEVDVVKTLIMDK